MLRKTIALLLILSIFSSLFTITYAAKVNSNQNNTYSTRAPISNSVKNIVKRAYQMTDIRWTPVANIKGWNGEIKYYANKTYEGLPYGQPTHGGKYINFAASLNTFSQSVANAESNMYRSTAKNPDKVIAPYYSIDCSAFVSYAWGLDKRCTTATITEYATKISSSSYDEMEVGDCLNRYNYLKKKNHVVLVTDITYDYEGFINGIEISEATVNKATNYCCQRTWYGTNQSKTLEDFYSKYFGDGYILYRRNSTLSDVTYTHNCNVPINGDNCSTCSSAPMYRLYNPNSGEHFYTGSSAEKNNLVSAGWKYEGIAFNATIKSGDPVYRLLNPNTGGHHYTDSTTEKDNLVAAGWQYEGVAFNSAPASISNRVPMYRLFNPNAHLNPATAAGSHHYTGSIQERDNLVKAGWQYEGIGFFGVLG